MRDMTLFDGLRTQRAIREFTEEPVSDAATLHLGAEREITSLLGIPEHVQTVALVPVGHPKRKHGPPRRIPAAERTHRDRWGAR
jgi:nitroreductase